ncbi:MAG: hypothetical protein IJY27_00920 [Clostridia bacterium]|nr:hypothetical protein [Clostridia bacterium]
MKKTISVALIILTLLSSLLLTSCGAPELGEIQDRVIELVEASYEINDIFFGDGLETYPRVEKLTDQSLTYNEKYGLYYLFFEAEGYGELCMYYDSEEKEYKFASVKKTSELTADDGEPLLSDEESGLSFFASDYVEPEIEYVYGEDSIQDYDVVRADEKYLSIAEIKAAAEKVYTEDFLEQIYQGAFDGVAYSEGSAGGVRSARFIEYELLLRQRNDIEPQVTKKRIYDYSTMKIVRPSNKKRVNIKMDTHIEGESEILSVTLTLMLADDGMWYLDTPTY